MILRRLLIAFLLPLFVFAWGVSGYMLKGQEEVYRVEDITISVDSVFIGKTLRTSGLPDHKGLAVAAVRKGDRYLFNPSEDEILEISDAVILIGETERIREIKQQSG